MSNEEKLSSRTVTLCGGGSCCPTVTFQDEKVIITDDFGGTVTLTAEEYKLLQNADDPAA